MKNRIEKYKADLENVTNEIKSDLESYFKEYDHTIKSKNVEIYSIRSESDIDQIYSGPGFYIILTDHHFVDNRCEFSLENQTAIYRGHSYFTKKRLSSHLSKKKYRTARKDNDPDYKVCIKVEDGVDGINVDQEPYNKWNWTVIVHKMKHSTSFIREQAEHAFDGAFGKPCKSKEPGKNDRKKS